MQIREIELAMSMACMHAKQESELLNGISLDKAANLLRIDDYRLLSHHSKNPKIDKMISDLNNGNLWAKVLILSERTVENRLGLFRLIRLDEEGISKFKDAVIEGMVNKCTKHDILLDLPSTPSFRETYQIFIKTKDDIVSIRDYFPIRAWLSAYVETHWEGRVLCPKEYSEEVTRNTKQVLKESFEIRFKGVRKRHACC